MSISARSGKSLVSFDDRAIYYVHEDGITEELEWDRLTEVEIVTTDQGPFVEDVFWVLHVADQKFVIPQSAEGTSELSERLGTLPGFNYQAAIDAMSCANNCRFPLWTKETRTKLTDSDSP